MVSSKYNHKQDGFRLQPPLNFNRDKVTKYIKKMKKKKFTYVVDDGIYEADTFIGLLLEILGHRLYHFFRGEGWRD